MVVEVKGGGAKRRELISVKKMLIPRALRRTLEMILM
jgi:hypothetical protein